MMIPLRHVSLVALLIMVPVSTWAIAYRPMNKAVGAAASEIRTRTKRLANFDSINEQYRKMKSMAKSMDQATVQITDRIPADSDEERWLRSASDAAKVLGLQVRSVTTSGEREEEDYRILPVDISVSGSYSNVYLLLQHFERMDRLTRIERMTIQRVDNDVVDARLIVHLIFENGEEK